MKGKSIIKVNPKIVHENYFDENKLVIKFIKNQTKLIQKILKGHGFEHFEFLPTIFILPNQFQKFKSFAFFVQKKIFVLFLATFEREKGIWIIKPIASSFFSLVMSKSHF